MSRVEEPRCDNFFEDFRVTGVIGDGVNAAMTEDRVGNAAGKV